MSHKENYLSYRIDRIWSKRDNCYFITIITYSCIFSKYPISDMPLTVFLSNSQEKKCKFIYFELCVSQVFSFWQNKHYVKYKYGLLILKQFTRVSLYSLALSQIWICLNWWIKLLYSHYLHCTAYQCWRPGFPKAIYSTGNTSRKNLLYPPGAKAFLLVTDNRRSQLDSPFCQSHSTGKLNLVITDKVRRYAVQELTMQLSQTLSSPIAQINVSNSYSTNQSFKEPNYKSHRKDLA